MYLFYDTETTGTNTNRDHLVQLAALLTYPDGREAGSMNFVVKCPIPIPPGAANVHGITNDICESIGMEVPRVLDIFEEMLSKATVAVAYNDTFDVGILRTAYARIDGPGGSDPFASVQRFCAMNATTAIYGKKIKLMDAHQRLTGEKFDNAHDAMADVRACARVFFAIMEKRRVDAAAKTGASA